MKEIMQHLTKNFGLDENQINIFTAILNNNKITAKEIAKISNINSGRIYEYINDLVELNLINKSNKRPYEYSVGDINESIIKFTKNKIDNLINAQSVILEHIDSMDQPYFERITSSSLFTKNHISMLSESTDSFKYISLHRSFPYLLYPFDKENFIKLRKAITNNRKTITNSKIGEILLMRQTYIDACEKKINVEAIFEVKSFRDHIEIIKSLGDDFFEDWRKTILEQFKKYNINVYVLNEHIPFQIDINSRKVNVSFRHDEIINGITIQEEDMVKLYTKVFQQYKLRSQNIIPLLQNLNLENEFFQEIHIKAKINNSQDIIDKLNNINATFNDKTKHTDKYYNISGNKLPIFRIRTTPVSTQLSIFGKSSNDKEEIAWNVWKHNIENHSEIEHIFLNASNKPIAIIEKESTHYTYKDIRISIDKIKKLGLFIDITTLTNNVDNGKNKIYKFLELIDINKKTTIPKGYVTLMLESKKSK